MFTLEGCACCISSGGLTDWLCCRPVHGLIFLFKWQPGEEPAGSIVQDSRLDQIFFAKQVCLLTTVKKIHNVYLTNGLFFTSETMVRKWRDALIRVLPRLQMSKPQTFVQYRKALEVQSWCRNVGLIWLFFLCQLCVLRLLTTRVPPRQ